MVPTSYQELVLQSLGQYRERVKQEAEEQFREKQEQFREKQEQFRERQEQEQAAAAAEKRNTSNAPSGKKDIFRPYCLKDPERKTVFPPYLIKVSKTWLRLWECFATLNYIKLS